ncbi:MAG: GatB/YqeY domain-containing protein [Simkaniaceae bacterium]|nr:GatB/YqeY domain-containing protein [Simkaniaceae bacterium]
MSTLIEKINTAFRDAYKDKNFDLKNSIGTIKGEIEREVKDPKNISDDEVSKELKKMIKNHNSGKTPLTEVEVTFIDSVLPKQMTEEEIDAKLKELVDGGANHIGKIMGGFKGANADMKIVKQKADAILN